MIRLKYFWSGNFSALELVDLTDAVLLERLRSGDHNAFDQFYAKYWKPLYRLAYKILKDEQGSEDAVQETFVRFWENRQKIENTNIKGWLSTTSYRLVLKTLQVQKQQNSIEETTYDEPLAEPADQSLNMHQLHLQIEASVDQLPDQCRKVYMLSREENLSVKNIAEELGISPKTVEAHITTALKRIRRGLGHTVLLFFFFI